MSQPKAHAPAQVLEAINRCAEAYHHVKAQLPKDANFVAEHHNENEACQAYLAQLPILFDPQSFQLYIACIAHGASVGAIDPIDVGRFCHLAQTAMSAWKLANLTAPAAQKKENQPHPLPANGNQSGDEEPLKAVVHPSEEPQNADPLPPKGNHSDDEESPQAAADTPGSDTQNQPDQSLKQPYIPGSGINRLRREAWITVQALKQAGIHPDKLPPVNAQPGPEPSQEASQEPVQVA